MSVREVFDHLRNVYQTRSYEALRPHIHPAQREELVSFLMAIDELLAANAAALGAMPRTLTEAASASLDLSPMSNRLELFSRDVDLIGVAERGDRAEITVQIARRVPLSVLTFHRYEGRWVYWPGERVGAPTPGIRALADALNRLAIVLADGAKTEKEIREEIKYRIEPRLRRLLETSPASPPHPPSTAGSAS